MSSVFIFCKETRRSRRGISKIVWHEQKNDYNLKVETKKMFGTLQMHSLKKMIYLNSIQKKQKLTLQNSIKRVVFKENEYL